MIFTESSCRVIIDRLIIKRFRGGSCACAVGTLCTSEVVVEHSHGWSASFHRLTVLQGRAEGPLCGLFNMERARLHCHGFRLQSVVCEGLSNLHSGSKNSE
jgi:hypothetical protein